MKKLLIAGLATVLLLAAAKPSHANGWEEAGKALTILTGLRIISGDRIDPVGVFTKRDSGHSHHSKHRSYRKGYDRGYHKGYRDHHEYERVCVIKQWVPHYVYKTKYIPRQKKYDPNYGTMITIEGHYVEYKEEHGGHWETSYQC